MVEVHSTYQWELSESKLDNISVTNIHLTKDNSNNVEATIKIKNDNVFAIINGTYEVEVEVEVGVGVGIGDEINTEPETLNLTCKVEKPTLCEGTTDNYYISLTFTGNTEKENLISINGGTIKNFKILVGVYDDHNNYLYILNRPTIIQSFTIDSDQIKDKKYIKGSAIPIDRIDISTIDFHNFTIRGEQKDIFYKLAGDNGYEKITTNKLSIPELTVVNLPKSEDDPINICKTKSMNKGITFKTSDLEWPNSDNHFGYVIVIDIPDNEYRSAGYNSVWVNRDTLDKMFIGMPNDIMSTTDKFIYDKTFKLRKLTYEEKRLVPEHYLNKSDKTFENDDITRLNGYAPECYKGTINESDSDVERHHLMTLKNIEFVKFGDKVIKLNYEPLSEAQNQSI